MSAIARQRKRRAPQAGNPAPSTTPIVKPDLTFLPGYQRHEPVTAEDRHEAALLTAAAEMGYRLATRCLRCNQWIVAPKSVAAHMGPVCRAKVVG